MKKNCIWLLVISYVTLGKLCDLFELQHPNCKTGEGSWEDDEAICAKHSARHVVGALLPPPHPIAPTLPPKLVYQM